MTTEVQTSYGIIDGLPEGGVIAFKGIPFASPPVGELRFKAPQKPEPWGSTLKAHAFSKSAIQSKLPSETGELIGIATNGTSEDCLYLNVWTPGIDNKSRPVMVWIHGGGNTIGSASQPRFDGQYLSSAHDVVVVTINYRLGPFGFLHLPEAGASGNEALLDQIAALHWVRDEISAFGGDCGNLTVFGQSAGGFDIAALLGMHAAAGCFDKAVPMSGSLNPEIPKEAAAATAARFVEEFGGADGLMAAPAHAIHDFYTRLSGGNMLGGVRFGPVLDGEIIIRSTTDAVRDGTYNNAIPMMIGTTLNEATLFSIFNPSFGNMTEEDLTRHLQSVFPENADEAITVYRSAAGELGVGEAPLDVIGAFMTDRMFRNPAITTAELQGRYTNIWMYLFDFETPAAAGRLHACHSLDIPFVFGTHHIPSMLPFCGEGEVVADLTRVMMATYAAFARNGNPNNEMLPEWPTYDNSRATMRLGTNCHVQHAPLDTIRELWANR